MGKIMTVSSKPHSRLVFCGKCGRVILKGEKYRRGDGNLTRCSECYVDAFGQRIIQVGGE